MSAISEVGAIKRVFKPGIANLSAGIILGLLLIGGGVLGLIASAKAVIENRGVFPEGKDGWNWFSVGLIWIVSPFAMYFGVFIINWMKYLMSLSVDVGEMGLWIKERQGHRAILWDDIRMIEERHDFERRKYGLPPRLSQKFSVILRDGEPFFFEENAIKGHLQLADMIKAETERRSTPWTIKVNPF